MITVAIIGNGNVATHLFNAFSNAEQVAVTKHSSRNLVKIPTSDISIIAVSDDAIKTVSNKLKNRKGLIAHTSGAVTVKAISNRRKGVFYPLQTFTKDKTVDFNSVPFCLEATTEKDYQLLEKLAKTIGKKIYKISSKQRKELHVAAVFVNNFTNHLYKIANDICDRNHIPFEILHPLIEETAKKINVVSPLDAQTGPAKRNDKKTLHSHSKTLNLHERKIYKLLTKSIKKSHNGEKL